MWNDLTKLRAFRLALLALAIAILTAASSAPAGAKGKPLSQKELGDLIAKAETKADHERIAQYFDAEAAKYGAEAKKHGELAQLYQRNSSATPTKYPGSMQSFQHCDSLSKSLQDAAERARQLAADHRETANHVK